MVITINGGYKNRETTQATTVEHRTNDGIKKFRAIHGITHFLEETTTRLVEDISVEGLTIDGTTVEAMKIIRPVGKENHNRKQYVRCRYNRFHINFRKIENIMVAVQTLMAIPLRQQKPPNYCK